MNSVKLCQHISTMSPTHHVLSLVPQWLLVTIKLHLNYIKPVIAFVVVAGGWIYRTKNGCELRQWNKQVRKPPQGNTSFWRRAQEVKRYRGNKLWVHVAHSVYTCREMKTQGALLLLLLTGLCIDGYKPVIIVHGILDGPKEFKMLSFFINKVGWLKINSLSHSSVLKVKLLIVLKFKKAWMYVSCITYNNVNISIWYITYKFEPQI